MLFTVYGVNLESITVVVSAFMLGLGLGSLLGGRLTRTSRTPPLLLFAYLELAIALFGIASPSIFDWVTAVTLGASLLATAGLSFLLVVIPTVLMGASLPLLVAHLLGIERNMGRAVGFLYFVNTLGSAAACFVAVYFAFANFGLSGTIELAAVLNGIVATGAFVVFLRGKRGARAEVARAFPEDGTARSGQVPGATTVEDTVPLWMVLTLAAFAGFISLSYEVLLVRAYSFVSAGRASAFPLVLGWFLLGIAVGSLLGGIYCARSVASRKAQVKVVGVYFLAVNVLGFATIPAMAHLVQWIDFERTYPLVGLLSGGLGATLPLVTHVGIAPDHRAAERLSFVYVANIVGSTLGSLLTGFVAMQLFSLPTIVTVLSLGGIVVACALLIPNSERVARWTALTVGAASCLGILTLGDAAFSHLYERLLWKEKYRKDAPFQYVVENRSGVVTVTRGGMVFGGGIYDGQLNVDLVYDRNGIVRPYMLSAFHPEPKKVLMIGLATGAWAQVLAHHPEVERVLAIEINPGYLDVIDRSDDVRSLLKNPKFSVVIDDGRRWLARHPEEKFDLIVMNTTFHWHAYAANLLSVEFLGTVREHLAPGGIAIYNTTSSPEAQRTGAVAFDHALRFFNNMIVSSDPLVGDEALLRRRLETYRIDGTPIFDLRQEHHRIRFDDVVALLGRFTTPPDLEGFETRARILDRTRGVRLITDDNMGTEWTHDFEEKSR